MQIKQIEELLLQEMEEIKGGAVGTCNCKNGAAQGSTDEGVCNCDSGAAQRPSTNTDTPDLQDPHVIAVVQEPAQTT